MRTYPRAVTQERLGASLAGRQNSLNFLRLSLASLVIVGHTWPVGGFGTSRFEGVSGLAVNGFFILSGFLIAGSRMRLGIGRFLWHRTLRIMPAFWVCLAVIAFVWSPVASALAGEHWSRSSAAGFVTGNFLLEIQQYGIDHTLEDVPYDGVWDGSLWTLRYEFIAYVGAALVLTLPLVRRHHRWALTVLAVLACLSYPVATGPAHVTTNLYLFGLRLGAFFAVGMALWSWKDKIPSSRWLALGCAVLVALLFTARPEVNFALTPLPLGYLLLWLGGTLGVRIGVENDISYGVYIYAFPVQQSLALAGAPAVLGFAGMAGAALLLTVPLAWLSWILVERPALRLKNLGRTPLPAAPQDQPASA